MAMMPVVPMMVVIMVMHMFMFALVRMNMLVRRLFTAPGRSRLDR